MNRWAWRGVASLVLAIAAQGRSAVAGNSFDEIITPARAWYAAIDTNSAADLATFYVGSVSAATPQQDSARFRGVPIEYGSEVASGDEAWLQIHAGTGEHFLVSWKRVEGVWKIRETAALTPELFLRRRINSTVSSWPSGTGEDATAAGVVFRFATVYRDEAARAKLSAKELEAKYLHPANSADREGYSNLMAALSRTDAFTEVRDLKEMGPADKRTATAVLRAGTDLDLGLVKTPAGWRIATARVSSDMMMEPTPSDEAKAAALATARKVLSALATGDAQSFASLALDLTSPTPRTVTVEKAKEQIAALQGTLGKKFEVAKPHLGWRRDASFSVSVDAPDGSFSKRVVLDLVLVGGALRLRDMNDGTEQVNIKDIVPGVGGVK